MQSPNTLTSKEELNMKIFIETDLEGISGVAKIEQVAERDE